MSRLLENIAIWVLKNPAESAVLGYSARYAPVPTAKIVFEFGKFGYASIKPGALLIRNTGNIVLTHSAIARGIVPVASRAAPIAAGVLIGGAAGVAISQTIWGNEGRQKAIDFYSGRANLIDYVPAYNAYKIVKHYVTN
jgi:hypothetical protein